MERGDKGIPTTTLYRLSDDSKLVNYVGHLETTAPAGFIQPGVLCDLSRRIDIAPALDNLPPGITIDDFEGINWLSALTECATVQYANMFAKAGDKYNAPWLTNFTRNIWEPDEMGHHAPFQIILMQMGVSQDQIASEVSRVQSMDYIHMTGDTPAHLTAFGMVQEFLTRNWYTQTKKILQQTSPEAARMVNMVEAREALHTRWYRDMTALQIEENPELVTNVAEALRRFQMPGNVLVPDLQQKAQKWLPTLHKGNLSSIERDIIKLTHSALGSDTNNLGKVLVEIGAQSDNWVERVTMQQARKALNTVGGKTGYGLLGEGVLQAVGLEDLYENPTVDNIPGKIRAVFRNYVARRANNTLNNQFGLSERRMRQSSRNQ